MGVGYMWKKYELWLLAAMCCLAAMGLHGLTINSPPIFDDKLMLTPGQVFTRYIDPFSAGLRWLSYGTFAWTYQAVGANWPIFRIENMLLHAATVAALFFFYFTIFKQTGLAQRLAMYMAGAGALLFAIHPISVYAVSYLIQRSIIMATLFSLVALIALLKATQTGQKKWLVMSALAYALALSSKEHAFMLPLVAGAIVFLLSRNTPELPLKRGIVYIVLAFVAALVVVMGLYGSQIGTSFDQTSRVLVEGLASKYPTVGAHAYLLSVVNESYLFFKYLILWLLPNPNWMSIDMRQAFPVRLTNWPQLIGPFAFLLYGLIAAKLLRKGGTVGLAGFGMLVPWLLYPTEFATIWIQDPFVLYRSYIWLIGLPAVLPLVYEKIGARQSVALLAVLALGFTASTIAKQRTFKSEYELWNDAVRYNERSNNPLILGKERALNERALQNLEAGRINEALSDYNKAIEINPKDASLYTNRAALYVLANRFDLAAMDIERALSADPKYARARYNRAVMYARSSQIDKALEELNAILDDPQMAMQDAYETRGLLLLNAGDVRRAREDFDAAIQRGSRNVAVFMNRAVARAAMGELEGAIQDFSEAIRLNPSARDAYVNRALALLKIGRANDALADADTAISLDALAIKPHLVRAQIYVSLGRIEDALAEYERILEKSPNVAMALLNRGEVRMAIGQKDGARSDLAAACKMGMKPACEKLASLSQ